MWMTINRESGFSLTRQIYNKVREMILDGSLVSGEKLPSTRWLSQELGVSRNTVLEVYNQMIAEGYLEARHGSGTTVASGIPKRSIANVECDGQRKVIEQKKKQAMIDFRSGVPALQLFPRKEWSKLYQKACSNLSVDAYGYCGPGGVWQLRTAIAKYLFCTRGIVCEAKQIVITSGSTQGLSLIARLLHTDGKKVLVEDPTHPGLRKVIAYAGCQIEGVTADDKGLKTECLKPGDDVAFIYTTPSHQYPLGGILPIKRRLSLVQYAEKNNCYIVEDDYDGEFRYEGPPVSALYGLNPERIIYMGSFSKILTPAIRIGFIILPHKLLSACETLKNYSDVHTDALTQYTLAEFIRNGSLEKHIWKMKKHYSRNRNYLLRKLAKQFPGAYEIVGQATGLHVVVRFYNISLSQQQIRDIAEQGVRVYPLSNYVFDKSRDCTKELIMGYSHLSTCDISKGIDIIHDILCT